VAVTVLVAYDISNDNRRARASAALQEWGDRIQRSVFLCLVDPEDVAELTDDLERIIDTSVDVLHVFRLCSSCAAAADARGQAMLEEAPLFWIV